MAWPNQHALIHLAKTLVALGLIILDEVTTLPEEVKCLTERLQSKLWLDEGADHQTTVGRAAAEDSPQHVHNNLHLLIVGINVGHQGIHGLGEVITGANVRIGRRIACGFGL